MRLACFGDLHGHKFKEFDVRTNTGSQRLDYIVATVRYIRTWCNANSIKHVLFSGDLFHARGKVDTEVFNAIYDEIENFGKDGITVIMCAGNHDQYDNSDIPENSLHSFKKLPNVYVYDTVSTHRIEHVVTESKGEDRGNGQGWGSTSQHTETVEVVVAPYSKNAQIVKDYIASVEKKSIPQVLLFHLGISGGFVGSGSYPMADAFEVEDLRPDLFKYVVGGHFHKRQFLGEYSHVFYCGAPIQHSFGDEGEDKGFYVIDTNKRYDVQFVPIPNPQFHTVQGNMTSMHEEFLNNCANNGDYVRFLVTESQLKGYEPIIPKSLHYKVELQRVYEEQARSDVKVGMSFEEIVSRYADENNPGAKQVGLSILKAVEQA